ncbi:MAG: glycosyltransferase family 2 protein [Patescibacteria group bacterium]|nr:glycosyltransferase family 2 protein [Patescibacteria group bacterium]
MDFSVITVTYNSSKIITAFLNSLIKNLSDKGEIIVVDNNSKDETVKIVKDIKSKVGIQFKIIEATKNLGYGRGNNLGVKNAQGKYLLFLNPDTEITDNSILKLLEFIKTHQEAGIVAPRLIQQGGKVQPSVRKLPTVWGAIKEYFLGQANEYEAYVPQGNRALEVESVVGAAIFISKHLFESVGGFNEKYFMYFEDLDLCRKILKQNKKIYYLPEATFIHKVGESSGYSPQRAAWLKVSARLYCGLIKYSVLQALFTLLNLRRKLQQSNN